MHETASKIKGAELEVMKLLWAKDKPMLLIDIRHELSKRCDWEDSTVKTLIRRLVEKGAIALESRGVYRAVVTENEYNAWSSSKFIDKVFAGSAKKLVASLLSDGQLTRSDMEELSRMFNGGSK